MSSILEIARARFQREGYCLTPPIIPLELIQRVIPHMDAVITGQYETGVPPHSRQWNPGDDPQKIRKIDQSHLSDRTIFELICHPEIGRWAAELLDARMIQVWATQLLYKPPGGNVSGNVGWHQDKQYWPYWEGEVFTAWVAVSDVTEASGPMRFVRGSHRWGLREGGNFFESDHHMQRQQIQIPDGHTWDEAAAVLPSGAVSFHHHFTCHGSGPNTTTWPRRSFALHLRTERSRPVEGASNYYISHLDDPAVCPVIYRV
ncbi:MAG: phytanoyl-CoA dioxygenase family protein [Candidatus Latescibacteria bacterium]|nr:phytanoyl-CoA dioxygenase family protein [Candidatus Latescibacterota bacterium]